MFITLIIDIIVNDYLSIPDMPVSQTYFGVIKFKRCHLIFRRSPSLAAFPPSVFVVCIRDEISLSFASFLLDSSVRFLCMFFYRFLTF